VLAALVLAACGGSSSSSSSAQLTQGPVQVAHPKTPVPKFVGVNRDTVSASRKHPVKARPPQAGTADDELNSTGRRKLDPCTLVSRAEVQTVLHQRVGTPIDAPQGPTCIYKGQHTKGQITIAVNSNPFSKVKPQAQLRGRSSLKVAGHTAYCGTAGAQTMIVPLAEGRSLTVVAPCPIAAALAAKALAHING
jgi:hypothetical protein